MQAKYFIASGFDLFEGNILSNEMFSESPQKTFFAPKVPDGYVNNLDYLARRQTELRLEAIRANSYGELPSRKIAIFLNKSETDAWKWIKRGTRSKYHIYELHPTKFEVIFEANYVWYNYIVRLHKNPFGENRKLFSLDIQEEIGACLEAYWKNIATEMYQSPTQAEILFVGELCVVRKIV